MTALQVQKAIRKRPFKPFMIRTTGGQIYRVGHPESIWQAPWPEETTVILHDPDAGVIFTDTSCFDAILFPKAASSKGNGSEPEA